MTINVTGTVTDSGKGDDVQLDHRRAGQAPAVQSWTANNNSVSVSCALQDLDFLRLKEDTAEGGASLTFTGSIPENGQALALRRYINTNPACEGTLVGDVFTWHPGDENVSTQTALTAKNEALRVEPA